MTFIKNILLVDDDADDQLFFTDALKEIDSGIQCVIANNGKEALEQLRNFSTRPEILFLDLNMPFQNGYEFLKHFKNEPHLSDIPVIIFTTSSDRKDAELAHRLGAHLFFSKPNEFSQLCSGLEYILNLDFKADSAHAFKFSF
jgi:CheY-like chemotaxis protein